MDWGIVAVTAVVFWVVGFWTCLWVNSKQETQAAKFPGFGDFSESGEASPETGVERKIYRRGGEELHESNKQVKNLKSEGPVNVDRDKYLQDFGNLSDRK